MENIIKTLIYLFINKNSFIIGNLDYQLISRSTVYNSRVFRPFRIHEENKIKFIIDYHKDGKLVYFTYDFSDSKKGRMKK